MKLPIFSSLHGYRRDWLRGDIVAGLTVWAVVVPESLAYATIAGVSPVVGLYAAPAAMLVYAVFGSSRHLIVGPMAATAALSAAAIASASGTDPATATAAIALLVAVFALIAGILRLGFLANFISEPVMKGFIIGLALTIMVGQLPKLFGIDGADGNFFEKLWGTVSNLGDTKGVTLAVGLGSLAVVLLLRRFAPRIPASLVAAALGILAVTLLGLDDRGVDIVGPIESGLPTFALPDLGLDQYLALAGGAAGIMLVGFAEGLGAARTYAARHHYEVDPNRELLGLGVANAASALASGMVVNGSLSKTAVNGDAGAKSQVSSFAAAGLTIVTLLFLTGLFANLPEATLAAVVIAALIDLVDYRALVAFYHTGTARLQGIYGRFAARPDFVAASTAALGVLLFDTLPGLVIGIAVSLLLLLYRASRPYVAHLGNVPGTDQYSDLARNPENVAPPGIAVLRVEGGLFFANSEYVGQQVRAVAARDDGGSSDVRAVVLDLETAPFVDVTAARMITLLAHDLEHDGITLAIAGERGQVRDVIRRAGTARGDADRPAETYPSVHAAVAALHAAPR